MENEEKKDGSYNPKDMIVQRATDLTSETSIKEIHLKALNLRQNRTITLSIGNKSFSQQRMKIIKEAIMKKTSSDVHGKSKLASAKKAQMMKKMLRSEIYKMK